MDLQAFLGSMDSFLAQLNLTSLDFFLLVGLSAAIILIFVERVRTRKIVTQMISKRTDDIRQEMESQKQEQAPEAIQQEQPAEEKLYFGKPDEGRELKEELKRKIEQKLKEKMAKSSS